MRNDLILHTKLENLWHKHFSDVPMQYPIKIKFGKKARKRLGSIRECIYQSKNNESLISINGHFKDKKIPEYIIDATIAHELCHYVHGFGSSLPQRTKYPHKDGIVEREMSRRGLIHLVRKEKNWLDENWHNHLNQAE